MNRLLKISLLLIGVCLLQMRATAQEACAPRGEIMNRIISVEKSDQHVREKIQQLENLKDNVIGCGLPHDSIYARILHRLGDLYRVDGDFETGIRLTSEAVAVNRTRTPGASRAFLTNSYHNLGLYYSLLSDFERSNVYFDSCILSGTNYTAKVPIALMAAERKCFNYLRMGEYEMILSAADHGIWIAEKHKQGGYKGIMLQQKAQAQLLLGAIDDAERNAAEALDILKAANVPGEYIASALGTMARIMVARKNEESAAKYFGEAIRLNSSLGYWLQCSRDYHDLGYFYDYTLRNPEKAIAQYEKGIEVLKNAPEPYQLAGLYNNIGIVHWRSGNYETALKYYQKGLQALPVGFRDSALSATLSHDMIRRISNDYFVAALLENKGESLLMAYKHSGNRDYLTYALNSFLAADKVIDQMRLKQVNENSKLFWREKTRRMYEHAVETCHLLNDVDNAFYFLEKSRAVLLSDKLNELGVRKTLAEEDKIRDRELRGKWHVLQASLQDPNLGAEEREDLRQRWYSTQQELSGHTEKLKHKYPDYFHYRLDTATVTIDDLRARIGEEEQAFVEYFTTDDAVYTLVIDANTSVFKKVSYPTLRKDMETFLEFCSNPLLLNSSYTDFVRLSNKLYKHLFESLQISNRRVVVSFDDYFIPLECLVKDTKRSNSFLVRDHVFLYVYSADFLLRKDKGEGTYSVMGVAPVWYQEGSNLSPLKGAEESLKSILGNFRESFALTRETATKASFLESFPHYGIVHVYSHAMADYEGEEPRLYFYDQPVSMKDLQLLPEVKTQLMVLSGCQTGVGRSIKGEGVLSLARGFAAAGIPSTITTLWSVDDRVTYRLMENFYRHLRRGMASDEALQQAKIDFLDQFDGENELPYYWASTVALGQNIQLKSSQYPIGRAGIALLILAAVVSAGVFFMRRKILLL